MVDWFAINRGLSMHWRLVKRTSRKGRISFCPISKVNLILVLSRSKKVLPKILL